MITDDASNAGVVLRAPMAPGETEAGEWVEIEYEGQLFRIPQALSGLFAASADQARRGQELAALQEALAQERRGFEAHAEATQATLADRVRLAALDDQLGDFEGIDWELLGQEDPRAAQALWTRFQQLAQARDRYVWSLTQNEHRARAEAEREAAEQLTRTGRALAAEIDGWSPEVAAKLVEYAGAFGVTLEELREVADPRLWKILHRAHQGDEAAKQRDTMRQTEQLQAVRPAVQIAGGGAASGVRDELGTREWMARRNDQALRGR